MTEDKIVDNSSQFFSDEEEEEKTEEASPTTDDTPIAEEPDPGPGVQKEPDTTATPEQFYQLPNAIKENFVPPMGTTMQFGPLVFEVCYRNPGKLRFSAELVGIREESKIAGPDGKTQSTTKPIPKGGRVI